jgi:hypothetical protein
VGRAVFALREADVRNPPKLAKPTKSKRRATQGRRTRRRN